MFNSDSSWGFPRLVALGFLRGASNLAGLIAGRGLAGGDVDVVKAQRDVELRLAVQLLVHLYSGA